MSLLVRKIILWSVTIVLAIALLSWWFNNFQKTIANFQGEEFVEKLNLPEISGEDLNKLEQILEEDGQ